MINTKKDSNDKVVITGLGLMTSVGHNAPQAVTSIRAGIARFVEVPEYEPIVRDPAIYFSEPLVGAPVSGVTDGLTDVERLLALSIPALKEALLDAKLKDSDLQNTVLFIAGGQRPDIKAGSRLATVFVPRLASRVSKVPFRRLEYFPYGTAGFLLALQKGMNLLKQGSCTHCVIGGVDSWLDQQTLSWLDNLRRVKSDSNVDGFVPGEAAAFVVIEQQANAMQQSMKEAYAQCGEVIVAEEQHTIGAETVCTAEALSNCLKSVVDDLMKKGKEPDAVLCDLNGESYRHTEWSNAFIKVLRDAHPAPPVILHPVDSLGDVGASIGGILVSLAAFAMKMDYVDWKTAIIWCSSDNGERAVNSILKL
jgi:3-oxoacyl-[acyl-carrier-protein] synthase-1